MSPTKTLNNNYKCNTEWSEKWWREKKRARVDQATKA